MAAADPLTYYAAPGPMTDLPPDVPGCADPAAVTRMVQGLIVHEFWAQRYGVEIPEPRLLELEARSATEMIDAIRALDSRPLDQARPPDRRIVGNCRQFATLACALLRGAGAPARARCGFASYFERGKWIDHWIVESWDGERWIRFDPQLDEFQRESLAIDFDTSRLTLERFLPGLSAWNRYRDGEEDPDRFGILDMWGAWFIRGNAVRDFAALNKVELLPWDTWGLMGREDEDDWVDAAAIGDAFFKLRGLYESCDLLRVPTEIWSARFGRRVTLAL